MTAQNPRNAAAGSVDGLAHITFADAIRRSGLPPPADILADGRIHRFSTNGTAMDDSGWYVLHGIGSVFGAFGDWRLGITETWHGRESSRHDAEELRRLRAQIHRQKLERIRLSRVASDRARQIWSHATINPHPYLEKKGIPSHGSRVYGNSLVVPMRIGETTYSLQLISPSGEKRFLPGGRVKGCYYAIGKLRGTIIIVEGFATGATVHAATGCAVAVAFSAGNLETVAMRMRQSFPSINLVIGADDDYQTPGNPGITRGTLAGQASGATVVIPRFGDVRQDGATDFNDMMKYSGIESVKERFRESI